jgi:zinc protease
MQLAAAIRTASARPVDRYVDEGAAQALMPMPPAKGSIVKVTQRPEAGITEWTLSNGATVVLKPTTLKERSDSLPRVRARRHVARQRRGFRSGASLATTSCRPAASAQLSDGTLDKLLNGRAVAVTPFIGDSEQGWRAAARRRIWSVLPAAAPALHAAAADPSAFFALSAQARALVATGRRARTSCSASRSTTRSRRNSPRRRPDTPATVGAVGPDEVARLLQGALRRRQPLHVRLRRQLHARRCSSRSSRPTSQLPATHAARRGATRASRLRGRRGTTIEKGIAPKSQVAIVFSGPDGLRRRAPLALRAMTMLSARAAVRHHPAGARRHLQHHRRAADAKVPRPEYTVRIEWACDPARTPALCKRVFDEIGS